MSTKSDEGQHTKNFALFLISILEDCAIQNAKMKTFILRLPEAKEPGFSLARLLAETELTKDTVRDLQQRYGQVRGMILEFPPRLAEAREALQQADEANHPD